jgi:hypothetical protein
MQGQESAGPEFPLLIISGQAAKTPSSLGSCCLFLLFLVFRSHALHPIPRRSIYLSPYSISSTPNLGINEICGKDRHEKGLDRGGC